MAAGDGHARQGDGEISGTGIEISMEMELRVDLRKNWTIAWPRGVTSDGKEIFTVGNARPLDQAAHDRGADPVAAVGRQHCQRAHLDQRRAHLDQRADADDHAVHRAFAVYI